MTSFMAPCGPFVAVRNVARLSMEIQANFGDYDNQEKQSIDNSRVSACFVEVEILKREIAGCEGVLFTRSCDVN